MIKRLLTILVLVSLTMTLLAGCGQEPPEGKVAETPSTTSTETESEAPDTSEPEISTPSEPSTPSTLTMLSITEGDVFVLKAGAGDWVEAEVGMTLEVGDTVKSGYDSNAEITFFDGSTIELLAGTQIEVVSLDIAADTGSTTIGLRQEIGNSISRVEKLFDPASSYEVETPAGVAAVRGSIMILNVFGDGTTWTTNKQGYIWFIAQGIELRIPEGRKCITILGYPPQLIPLGGYGGGDSFSPNPDIAIIKTPNLKQAHEGDTITYTYTVTNPGNVPLSDVSVTDDKIQDVTYQSGDTNGDGRLGTDETWVFTATYTVTTDDENPLVNTAAAAGTDAWFQTVIAWTTATVTVNAANDPPVAVDDSATTPEDTPVTIDVLANDSDVDGDTLTVDSVTQGTNGSVTNNGSDVTYTPNLNFNGTDSFTYTVSDGNGGFDTATVTVTVNAANDPPVAVDDSATTPEDTPVTIDVLANDSDVDGDTLTVDSVTQGTNGSVTNNGSNVTYTPNLNFNGTDSFTYTVSDGNGGFDTATVTVTVNAANDPPVAVDDSATTPEDTPVTIDVLANDSDVDGDTLTVDSVTQGTNGSVTNNGSDVTYTPNLNFNGTDSFTYTVSDGNGGFDTATVTVTVTAAVAEINIQIDTGPTASIFIWDETEGDWATDEDTQEPVDGNNHETSDTITVAAGHCYYVWVEKDGYIFDVKNYPNDWSITPAPEGGVGQAAYGCATAGSHYPIHFTGSALVIVRFPEEGTAYIGYEDMEGGDFDYNDFGMNMYIEEVYIDNCLTEIYMEFESVTKLSGGSHAIHILRTLPDTAYNYTITRSTTAQGEETPAVTNAPGQGDFDIVLFDTAYFTSGATVTVHIEITDGCELYDPAPEPPRWDLASIWAYYDPYMDYRTIAERHIEDWQPAVSPLPTTGYNVPYILVIPVTSWSPPGEGEAITDKYPYFDDYYDTGSPENWYELTN